MADFGTEEDGGFNKVTKAYKRSPSLELYVRLRREQPDAEIEVSVTGGMDQLYFMENELKSYGFDPHLYASILDADPDAISEMSLQIMEKMIDAHARKKAGETHLARRRLIIPDKLIDWLISCMLDSLSWNDDLHIPRDLIVLLRERLGGSVLEYEQANDSYQRRWNALVFGGMLRAKGEEVSMRKIAAALGVAPSTVSRWFPDGNFQDEIERIASWFDENGKPRPLLDQDKPSKSGQSAGGIE